MDNLCCFAASLGDWDGYFLYDGGVHSSSTPHRRGRGTDSGYSGTQTRLIGQSVNNGPQEG